MGQAKKLLMDFEEKVSILNNIITELSSNAFDDLYEPRLIEDLFSIRNMIGTLNPSSMSVITFISNIITDDITNIYSDLKKLTTKFELQNSLSNSDKQTYKKIVHDLYNKIPKLEISLQDFIQNKSHAYNSEEYYSTLIQEIQKQKNELENRLKTIQKEKNNIQGKNQAEREIYEKKIQEKELQLQIANQQLEEKKKQENAIEEWSSKIKATFKELKNYLQPIKNEHRRLNCLFWAYSILTGLVIIFIVILEIITCTKFHEAEILPKWKDYLILIFPIPITGALLWVFISQLNRAQRQLVILAKHIHEIEYIEGLLLSLNSLSININDSIKRVNSAIDKLLENHLSLEVKRGKYDEDSIVKEEKKDMVPIDLIIKLLKETKDLTSK